jgi:SNF2 family DNA or RNA helicase
MLSTLDEAPVPGEVAIVSYDSLPEPSSGRILSGSNLRSATLILDEVHYVRNGAAIRSKRTRVLARSCGRVWALSGTPLVGKAEDLWGVLTSANLARDTFGSWDKFAALFREKKKAPRGGVVLEDPTDEVRERLRTVMLRRLRADVLPDLPPKRYKIVACEASAELAGELDAVEAAWVALGTDSLPPFEMLSRVRALMAKDRIPQMLELVKAHEAESADPLVVFSAHRDPIDALEGRAGWETITGDTPDGARAERVGRFQAGELRGLALTIQAGGVGINLSRGHDLLFVDRSYTPSENEQAEDRPARPGQTADSILVTCMVADHAVDRRLLEILGAKETLIASVVGGAAEGDDVG